MRPVDKPPQEPLPRVAQALERENARSAMRREDEPTGALAPYRVGSVSYLNAVPLTRGLEGQVQFHPPARLAQLLHAGELDAALVSLTEVLFHTDYDVLDDIAVASQGEVYSVFLAHRRPLEQTPVIWVDPATCTSVNLLRVLLAERGLRPQLCPLEDYPAAPARDAVLLIGNPAIEFRRAGHPHAIWDLGAAWHELTGLPFVYAVWALRRERDTAPLRRCLRQARALGLDTLDAIIAGRREFDAAFRRDYLGRHIHYHLTADEKRGIARFVELLRRHQERPVFAPRYVS